MHIFAFRNARTWFAATLLTLAASIAPAQADTVQITYSPAGQTGPNTAAICAGASVCDYGMENFSAWTGSSTFTSYFDDAGAGTHNTLDGSTFVGTYTAGRNTTTGNGGEWVKQPQNIYGGVTGPYPELYGPKALGGGSGTASYGLALSAAGVPGVNYFGVWISALDAYNNLTIYDGQNVIAQFNAATLQAQLGSCPASAYCGNPTLGEKGADNGELFAYVNVFDLDGYITNVVFSDDGATGFESTNDAVAYINTVHSVGTVLGAQNVGEPGTLAIFGVALIGLGLVRRRQASLGSALPLG